MERPIGALVYSAYGVNPIQYAAQSYAQPRGRTPMTAVVCNQGACEASGKSLDDIVKLGPEAKHFTGVVDKYMATEGQHLQKYLKETGHQVTPVEKTGSMHLPDGAVAALVTYPGLGKSYMVSNGSGPGFEARVNKFAQQYALDKDSARDYVITHELMHAAGCRSESSCESAVGRYFRNRAKAEKGSSRYESLARTAEIRAREQGGMSYRAPISSRYQ